MNRDNIKQKLDDIDRNINKLRDEGRNKEVVEYNEERKRVFKEEWYPLMTEKEKISYWSQGIHEEMRFIGDYYGKDEMSIFTKEKYKNWKSEEPNIDKLFPKILDALGISQDRVFKLLEKE